MNLVLRLMLEQRTGIQDRGSEFCLVFQFIMNEAYTTLNILVQFGNLVMIKLFALLILNDMIPISGP